MRLSVVGCSFALRWVSFFFFASYIFFYSSFRITVELKSYKSAPSIEIVSGRGIVLGTSNVVPLSDNLEISVTAKGYQSQKLALSGMTKTISVVLEYDWVGLHVTSEKSGDHFNWYLDGEFVSSSSSLNLQVLPGEYQVEAHSDHYERKSLDLSVAPAQDFSLKTEFTRKKILFEIDSNPPGAEVHVDNELVGITPITGLLPSSSVAVSVVHPRYDPVTELVDLSMVPAGLIRKYHLKISKKQIVSKFNPPGGSLLVDGVSTEADPSLWINSIGSTQLQYSKEGYQTETKDVNAQFSSIEFNLVSVYGEVQIKSDPPALVSIGSVPYGMTPIPLSLRTARQKLELSRDGFVTQEIEFRPDSKKPTLIEVKLQSWFDYYLNESKDQVTNEIGVVLVRVLPKPLEIGAPRSQVGQRANELLRKVSFRRWIYISKHEITERQYGLFSGIFSKSSKPATNMSWEEAALFCNWLSQKEGLPPFYVLRNATVVGFDESARGYRLPMEAEWEYMARFHNKRTPSIFTWNNEYEITDSAGNIADETAKKAVKVYINGYNDGFIGSAPVGSFQKEVSGLYDQSGNVSEWVHDGYSLEVPSNQTRYTDYVGGKNSSLHFVKGSNYLSASWTEFRASFKESATGPRSDLGFRIARYIN